MDRQQQALDVIRAFAALYRLPPDSRDVWARMWLHPAKRTSGTLNFTDTCRTLRQLAQAGRIRRVGRAGGWIVNEP